MHALSRDVVPALELRVEGLDEQAVGVALGEHGGVCGDELQAGAVVADGELAEFFAFSGGLDVLFVVVGGGGGVFFDVGLEAGGLAGVGAG